MTQLQVTLPDDAGQFIQNQVSAGKFSSPSEYLSFLVERARAAAAKERLDDLLDEGLHSGPPIPFSSEWWLNRKAELLAMLPSEKTK